MLLCRLHPAREVQQRMHTQLQQLGSTTEQNAALLQHCVDLSYDPQGAATRLEAQAAARAHTTYDQRPCDQQTLYGRQPLSTPAQFGPS